MINRLQEKIKGLTRLENRMMFYLMIAMFLNPLGFDVLFAMIMSLTGSYWTTDIILYGLSAFFFGLFFYSKHSYNKQVNGKKEK